MTEVTIERVRDALEAAGFVEARADDWPSSIVVTGGRDAPADWGERVAGALRAAGIAGTVRGRSVVVTKAPAVGGGS